MLLSQLDERELKFHSSKATIWTAEWVNGFDAPHIFCLLLGVPPPHTQTHCGRHMWMPPYQTFFSAREGRAGSPAQSAPTTGAEAGARSFGRTDRLPCRRRRTLSLALAFHPSLEVEPDLFHSLLQVQSSIRQSLGQDGHHHRQGQAHQAPQLHTQEGQDALGRWQEAGGFFKFSARCDTQSKCYKSICFE